MSSPASQTTRSTGLMSCYRGIIRGKWTLTFALSLRDVKDLLAARGLSVAPASVRGRFAALHG
jgi:hypothetical protein